MPLGPRLRLLRLRLPPRRNGCKDCSPKKRRRYSPRPGLSPPHQTLLLCSSPEIGPSGGPRTHGGDVRAALSNAVNLTPRHTPGAAARSAPESPRTAGGAPPPPPAGRSRTWLRHHLSPDLDQVLAQGGQVPATDRPRQRPLAQRVRQVGGPAADRAWLGGEVFDRRCEGLAGVPYVWTVTSSILGMTSCCA